MTTALRVGDRVELRKHAKEKERETERAAGIDATTSRGRRWYEGVIEEVGFIVGKLAPQYTVRWDDGVKSVHSASTIKRINENTGKRARHDALYGEHGLQKLVEEEGVRLREAIRELYVPESAKREWSRPSTDDPYDIGYVKDFVGIDGVSLFDLRREHYEKLVRRYNKLARQHDRDHCC